MDKKLDDLKKIISVWDKDNLSGNCISDETLLEKAHNRAEGSRKDEAERHLDSCPRCRRRLESFIADNLRWESALEDDPDRALSEALDEQGLKRLKEFLPKKDQKNPQ
jgi:anti-sigma factor RsiW